MEILEVVYRKPGRFRPRRFSAADILDVQPMRQPYALIHYLKHRYKADKPKCPACEAGVPVVKR